MTARPLADDFPLASDLAARPPHAIGADELLLELDEELARRRQVFPGLIDRGALTREDAAHQVETLAAIRADLHASRAAPDLTIWEARVRELRRDLALRRNAYPKWIASPTNPLTRADAIRRIERLDALHWRYWMDMLAAPRNADTAHHVAMRELARREPDIEAAILQGGAPAAIATRLRNHLIALARYAAAIAAGKPRDLLDRADLLRLDTTLTALVTHRIAQATPVADGELAQLYLLECWLATILAPRPAYTSHMERLAA